MPLLRQVAVVLCIFAGCANAYFPMKKPGALAALKKGAAVKKKYDDDAYYKDGDALSRLRRRVHALENPCEETTVKVTYLDDFTPTSFSLNFANQSEHERLVQEGGGTFAGAGSADVGAFYGPLYEGFCADTADCVANSNVVGLFQATSTTTFFTDITGRRRRRRKTGRNLLGLEDSAPENGYIQLGTYQFHTEVGGKRGKRGVCRGGRQSSNKPCTLMVHGSTTFDSGAYADETLYDAIVGGVGDLIYAGGEAISSIKFTGTDSAVPEYVFQTELRIRQCSTGGDMGGSRGGGSGGKGSGSKGSGRPHGGYKYGYKYGY